ncbi:YetF domain-containing protein [Bacillus suaedaesalsae]|uniref:DUF421 domain-containing protein n=1 Tax=Bacillus suaedaesalsae TaxID=2810349 RepID=A0ABS2DL43_9BACI|nr:DUF421 domain-containing protein [Bacillus suaedaesalsae]MBM6618193.1 DUF421 domain-containing protein [Bacillus suaedaesalsae]
MNVTELLLRMTLSFLVLLTLTRIMGRQEISQNTFFNFVSAITIGTIGGSLVINQNLSKSNGVIALVGWTIFTLVMEFIDLKSKKARDLIEGQPVIVIKEGQILEKQMKKTRLDVNTLNAMLREKSIFSLAEVNYAIFETDGKLSVLKKDEKQPMTQGDLKGTVEKQKQIPIPTSVIEDGQFSKQNLQKLNLNEEWVIQRLSEQGIESISEVFYAKIQQDGSLYIDKRHDVLH